MNYKHFLANLINFVTWLVQRVILVALVILNDQMKATKIAETLFGNYFISFI